MASASPEPIKRPLPLKRNPLLAPEETPTRKSPYRQGIAIADTYLRFIDTELVSKRRLGQTNLTVKPGQVGTTSATKPGNLGQFDYAHLRAPLPKNLKGSEIFAPQKHQPHPEAYFLMVRTQSRSCDFTQSLILYERIAKKRGWLHQCDWHVQARLPVGAA